tara:strand:+ start:62 stop:262 length:201 start_codon:yes stop_codon:yes gene_type:complete
MADKITNINTKTEKKRYTITTYTDMIETYIILAKDEEEARDMVLSGAEAPETVSYQDEKIEFVVEE